MGEHDALGVPRGSRSVDDRGHVLQLHRLEALVKLILLLVCLALLVGFFECQNSRGSFRDLIEDDDLFQSPELFLRFKDAFQVVFRGDQAQFRAGMVYDVTGLICGVGRIDGDVYRADGEDGLVRHPPLVTVRRKERDPVALLYALGHQIPGELAYHHVHIVPGKIDICPVDPGCHAGLVAELFNLVLKNRPYRIKILFHIQRLHFHYSEIKKNYDT